MIGIIANPLSGKDIRRVVAQGAVTSNHEKINVLRRMLQGIAAIGDFTIRFMPDRADLVPRALDSLLLNGDVQPLPLSISGTADDTTAAAKLLREQGACCIIVLGGDGTCRAVAKQSDDVPLLPVSTGTNNAFPQIIEGTLAGLAAGVVARGLAGAAITRQPCLRILREGVAPDPALIDVASFAGSTGARAVWQIDRIHQIVTTRLTPGTIGLSAIGGFAGLKPPAPNVGLALTLGKDSIKTLVPVAPGVVQPVGICEHRWLRHGETFRVAPVPCVLALDGEREFQVRHGMLIDIQYDEYGPFVVNAQRALQAGVEGGIFAISD